MAIATTLSQPGISTEGIVAGTIEPVKFALFPGDTGDVFSTDDAAANDFSGDLDFSIDLQLVDWSDGGQRIVGKFVGGDISFVFQVGVSSELTFIYSLNGSAMLFNSSTINTNFANNSRHWVRVTRVESSGNITFFTSTDGEVWDQLGAVVNDTQGSLFNSSVDLVIGSGSLGDGNVITGRIYELRLKKVIDGTATVDFNPNDYESGSAFTSSTTGEEWTLNGAVTIEED